MAGLHFVQIEEFRIQASILLKSLRASDPEKSLAAAERFRCLPQFASASPGEIVAQRSGVRRKHALAVIARENGYAAWDEMKRRFEKLNALRSRREFTALYPMRCEGFLNEWYADYDTAREHLERTGGYLLPYRQHFFICKSGYIFALGLDPEDPDWNRIGRDWVRPADPDAWGRLNAKLAQIRE